MRFLKTKEFDILTKCQNFFNLILSNSKKLKLFDLLFCPSIEKILMNLINYLILVCINLV